jgi:hypothetical protein
MAIAAQDQFHDISRPAPPNSLFRPINSLFGREKFPVRKIAGDHAQHFGVPAEIDVGRAKIEANRPEIREIP